MSKRRRTSSFLILAAILALSCGIVSGSIVGGGDRLVASGTVTQANMKISAVDGTAFIDLTGDAITDSTPVATGAVTQANMRISAVDGTAFLDFTAASVLTDHVGKYVRVRDSAGKWIEGWIKAAGSAETLGGELITNPSFDAATAPWSTARSTIASVAGGYANNCLEITAIGDANGPVAISGAVSVVSLSLLKQSVYVKSGTDGDRSFSHYYHLTSIGVTGTSTSSWVQSVGYRTADIANWALYLINNHPSASNTMLFDEVSLKQVLAPSATGVTIVSTRGGTTYNYAAKDSAFNYNDTSGYTYQILSPNPLPLKLGHKLVIADSTGKTIQGYIKAAGTGETLSAGALNVSNCENGATTLAYETFDGVSATGFHAINSTDFGVAGTKDEMAFTALALYKTTFTMSVASGAYPYIWIAAAINGSTIGKSISFSVAGANTRYETITLADTGLFQFRVLSGVATEFTVSDLDVRKVLTPSATGATITTTKGGTTYNWSAKVTGFDYNDSSGYTYRIYRDDRLVQVATGSVTQANTRLDLTTDNAFAWLEGVDLSAYQTGDYYICLYNATGGYGACGWISSVAPAGETLDSELVSDGTFTTGVPWTTPGNWVVGAGVASYDDLVTNYITELLTGTIGISKLYKVVDTIAISSGNAILAMTDQAGQQTFTNAFDGNSQLNGTNTNYGTCSIETATFRLYAYTTSSNAFTIDGLSIKQVTDPPSTAVKIVSTHDGATRTWVHKHASFNPNDNAGITYKIYWAGDN